MKRKRSIRIDKFLKSLQDWHIYFLVALVGVIIYGKSIAYGFTYADDIQLLVVNQELLGNLANIPKLFTTDLFISVANPYVFYRPLLNILYMLEVQIAAETPLLYHITNIILHIGCSMLVYCFFKRLDLSKLIAGMAALVFCMHPLTIASVVWIPGRNDTLLTLLVLGSCILFLRTIETRRIGPFIGHFLLFFLALLTKESAIFIPVFCISYVLFIKREKPHLAVIVSVFLIYIIIIASWFIMRSMVPQSFEIHQTGISLAKSWLSNLPAFILYFGKVFLPFNLSIYPNMADHSLLLGLVSVVLFLGAIIVRRPITLKFIYVGLGWFFLFLAPTLILGPIFYEHRAYCSLVGILLAVSHLPLVRAINFSRINHVLGFSALVILFATLTMVHEEQYRNRTSYVMSALASAPSVDESYSGLAGMLIDEGNDKAAEKVLRVGIARKSTMRIVHRMLGDIYTHRHEYTLAAQEYETSLHLEPLQLYTYINYGKLCLAVDRIDDAIRLWKTSVSIDPNFFLGYYYLANCYIHCKNDPDSAMMYVGELQRRGVTVLPELIQAIEEHPSYRNKKP